MLRGIVGQKEILKERLEAKKEQKNNKFYSL